MKQYIDPATQLQTARRFWAYKLQRKQKEVCSFCSEVIDTLPVQNKTQSGKQQLMLTKWIIPECKNYSFSLNSFSVIATMWRWYFKNIPLKVKVTQLCLTLCDPMNYIVHGILQARILEWIAYPFSSGSSWPRNRTEVPCIEGGIFTNWAIPTKFNNEILDVLKYFLKGVYLVPLVPLPNKTYLSMTNYFTDVSKHDDSHICNAHCFTTILVSLESI